MEIIIAAIIGGGSAIATAAIAFLGYDRSRKNNQIFHAWQQTTDNKFATFQKIYNDFQKMGMSMVYTKSIFNIGKKNPTTDDWLELIAWNNVLRNYYNFDIDTIIPEEILNQSITWMNRGTVNTEIYNKTKELMLNFIISRVSELFLNINSYKSEVNLSINNRQILLEIDEAIQWLNSINQKKNIDYSDEWLDKFTKKYSYHRDKINYLMRYEIESNINEKKPTLRIISISSKIAKKYIKDY